MATFLVRSARGQECPRYSRKPPMAWSSPPRGIQIGSPGILNERDPRNQMGTSANAGFANYRSHFRVMQKKGRPDIGRRSRSE
jgi:hypothetical protein